MKKQFSLFSMVVLVGLSACSVVQREAYYDRGQPESLLDVSSEEVSMGLGSISSVDALSAAVEKDQPTRAELRCNSGESRCNAAMEVLKLYGVEYNQVAASDSKVTLIYDRVVARDCDNRYIDSHNNPYNLNHPVFGCSNSSNMVQMVTDKRQFIRPALLGFMDGEKAVKNHRDAYLNPPKDDNSSDNYTLKSVKQD